MQRKFHFVRFMSLQGPKEQYLELLLPKGQTHREDFTRAAIECMDKHHITLGKSITTVRNGFAAILKEINHEIRVYHYIIHLEELGAQKCMIFVNN